LISVPNNPQKKTCFVAMPIQTPSHLVATYGDDPDHFMHVLEELFVPAIEEAGMTALRPISSGSEVIHSDIIDALQSADLVLVDLSSLNPNVLFEFGVRTSLNKPACPIRDDQTPNIPFDAGSLNTPVYRSQLQAWITKEEVPKLSKHLSTSLERSNGQNALWKHFGFKKQAEAPAPPKTNEDKFDAVISELALLRQRLTDTRSPQSADDAYASGVRRTNARISYRIKAALAEVGIQDFSLYLKDQNTAEVTVGEDEDPAKLRAAVSAIHKLQPGLQVFFTTAYEGH
jgi:hypothetical protein